MFLIKNICIVIYIIVVILFTVGYASQPLIMSDNKPLTLFNITSLSDIKNTYTDSNYDNIDSNVKIALMSEYYLCIAITVLLSFGIICAFFKSFAFKVSSKILFIISLILMCIAFVILQILVIIYSLIDNVNNNVNNNTNNVNNNININNATTDINNERIPSEIKININVETSNGTGYYLILVSTILMSINYIIYTIFV